MATDAVTKTVTDWSSPYGSAVMQDQPLAYWRLGESSGTLAADFSGNTRDGNYNGGVTLGQPGAVSGDPDTASLFNGSSGYVTASALPALSTWTARNALRGPLSGSTHETARQVRVAPRNTSGS